MRHFADTNIVVYAYSGGPKAARASEVLKGAAISVQILNEFANVGVRKRGLSAVELDRQIGSIRFQVAAVHPVTDATHDLARIILFRYRLNFYDAALIAAALLADCDTFYSEDMQHGLVILDTLTIRNPFS